MKRRQAPLLSVILVLYNMRREAPRTLFSLSPGFQAGIDERDYEVIVVDNGSDEPLPESIVKGFGRNFRYRYLDTDSVSPCAAINTGAAMAKGNILGVMIDGARILSPGVLGYALKAVNTAANPVVATLSWHLGPDVQYRSVLNGYTREAEDRLLAAAGWEKNGYRLFEISSFAGSSENGFFIPFSESNCFFMKKQTFVRLGGFDERFNLPGGGLANLDTYKRACDLPDSTLIVVLGEGTFHQVHGGVCTNVAEEEKRKKWKEFAAQYMSLRGAPYKISEKKLEFIGHIPPEAAGFVVVSANKLPNSSAAEGCR